MRITLEVVRKTLRQGLGSDCFSAGLIKRVAADPDQASAGITAEGHLSYNPAFVEQYVTCPEDLFSLLLHELLHPLWAHFIRDPGRLENLAADAVINAAIGTLFAEPSAGGHLFRQLYRPHGLEGLLRPDSQLEGEKLARIYHRLYPDHSIGRRGDRSEGAHPLTTGELVRSLRILLAEEEMTAIVLLGSHPAETEEEGGEGAPGERWSGEDLSRVAGDLADALEKDGGRQGGHGSELYDLVRRVLASHLRLREDVLLRFATARRTDGLEEKHLQAQRRLSPLPLHLGRRDTVLLAAGIFPLHYRTLTYEEKEMPPLGLALYLDVSGSVSAYLPQIVGVLRKLEGKVRSVYQFSNEVVETGMEALLAGEVHTTYGTDFDCVAQSILEERYERAIVITDGYARLSSELRHELLQRQVRLLTVLYGHGAKCEPLAALGQVMRLEDVCGDACSDACA